MQTIVGLYRRLRALLPGRLDWEVLVPSDAVRVDEFLTVVPLRALPEWFRDRAQAEKAALKQLNRLCIIRRPDGKCFEAPMMLLNLSAENDRWNKMALGIAEKRRQAWPFDPTYIQPRPSENIACPP